MTKIKWRMTESVSLLAKVIDELDMKSPCLIELKKLGQKIHDHGGLELMKRIYWAAYGYLEMGEPIGYDIMLGAWDDILEWKERKSKGARQKEEHWADRHSRVARSQSR